MADEELVAIAKLVARQSRLINLASLQLADNACFIETLLAHCGKCNSRLATVEHSIGCKLCDRCASETIVRSGRNFVDGYINDPKDPLNAARSSLMDENAWVDLPNAERIRRLDDYVRIIKELELAPEQVH